MAPSQPSRHLLAWSLPAFALFLSYFWFKKKRLGHQSDTRGSSKAVNGEVINTSINVVFCEGSKRVVSENKPISQVNNESPKKLFSRSLSGVDSAPIDIVLPPDMRAAKSNQMIISDEDLDFEIEKIKSMRSTYDRQRSNNTSPVKPAIEFKTEKPASFESVPLTETKPVKEVEVETAKEEEEEEEEIETKVINIKVEEYKKEEVVQEVKESPQVSEEAIETPKEVCKEDNIVEEETRKQEEIKKEETVIDSPAPVQPPAETSSEDVSVKKNSTPPKSVKNKKGPNKQKDMAKKDVKPVQSEVNKVEEKFSAMKISGSGNSSSNNKKSSSRKSRSKNWVPMNMKQQTEKKGSNQRNETQRKSTDRDSANHSPADIMIASRSLSNISDNGSSDSGKGGSDVATPPNYGPPHDMYMRSDQLMIHEFEVPIELVGRLIGKKGAFVNQIKAKTNADIVVKSYPEPFGEQKICMVEGTPKEIDAALKMIRRKFPLESYPRLTLQSWSSSPIQLVPEKLKLIEGINNDTMVSCVDSPTHLFMQFPTHPSFPNLVVLHNCMQMCYQTESPELPNPVPVDAICAALSKDGLWYRAQILSADEENSFIRFLDWGGCEWVSNKDLRKIRYDFMLLPFQAAECILANLQPVGGPEAEWPEEALDYVKEVSHNAIIYTQVADYTPDGIPLVLCFVNIGTHHVVNLNRDLVEKGYAEWIEPEGESSTQ